MVKPGKRFKVGSELWFYPPSANPKNPEIFLKAKVLDRDEATGGRILQFLWDNDQSFWELLEKIGQVPLPPYITSSDAKSSQYQTVYAKELGAVAAPTAGLHFTDELLKSLQSIGIDQAWITLHVGVGTFRPVEKEDITQHQMHTEWLEVPSATVTKIQETKARGGRVIAVGTTVVRALEGAAKETQAPESEYLLPFQGRTDLFIYPGYRWRVIDGMITNFHLPKSSLLMLVSALIGRERLLELYHQAIQEKYRFYSFGDAMLILPTAVL